MFDISIFLVLACAFGFFMAWGVGANDVANAMGTSVGSKALTIRQAIMIAAVFEFAGAYLAGGAVTETIGKGMVDIQYFVDTPNLFVYGMLASLLAAGTWLLVASVFGWPVSTTHTIVGSIVGFTAVGVSPHAVQWSKILTIVASWITSPVIGAVVAYLLFMSVQLLIFNTRNPVANAKRYIPFYIGLTTFVVAIVTLFNGLSHIGLNLVLWESLAIAIGLSALTTVFGVFAMEKLHRKVATNHREHFALVEKAFSVLMGFTACAMAFAHGSNDVANAVGPIAAVYSVEATHQLYAGSVATPPWILFLGGVGIIVGLMTYGHKVIQTIGQGITELTPSRGFAVTLAAASTVVVASGVGLPISTTHTLVGAVLGVGLARGIGALNLEVVKTIFTSWLVTLPAGAVLAITFFYLLQLIF